VLTLPLAFLILGERTLWVSIVAVRIGLTGAGLLFATIPTSTGLMGMGLVTMVALLTMWRPKAAVRTSETPQTVPQDWSLVLRQDVGAQNAV